MGYRTGSASGAHHKETEMQTTKITLDQLKPGDMVFAENEDAQTGAIHGKIISTTHDVTTVLPVSHSGGVPGYVRVRTGLFGTILRIEG
jgi:hypothetical protein